MNILSCKISCIRSLCLRQRTHSLYGLLMFILLIKCCSLLRLNEAMTTAVSTVIDVFSGLLWPLVHKHSDSEHINLNENV